MKKLSTPYILICLFGIFISCGNQNKPTNSRDSNNNFFLSDYNLSLTPDQQKTSNHFIKVILREYDIFKSKGEGITDMKPGSKFVKKIESYLKNSKYKVLFIGTSYNYADYISKGTPKIDPKLYKQYVVELNKRYSKLVGPKNDGLISLDSQLPKDISNKNLSFLAFENVHHYQQINNKEILSAIAKYILDNGINKDENIKIILLHGVNPGNGGDRNYITGLIPPLKSHFKNAKFYHPKYADFINGSLDAQIEHAYNEIKNEIKNDARVVIIGHSQGTLKAIGLAEKLAGLNIKPLTICIGGPIKGASGLINTSEKLETLGNDKCLKAFINKLVASAKSSTSKKAG